MGKYVIFLSLEQTASFQVVQVSVEPDPTKSDDHSQFEETFDLTVEVRGTVRNFSRSGLIVRRGTAGGGCDVGMFKRQTVASMGGHRLSGEPCLVQNRVHEETGGVAGKW